MIQVNTGKGCHLDAQMIRRACDELAPADDSVLMIENVGNLVCPAMFDLGEAAKVVIISVTEGDDKPLKYPTMFAAADLCLINKIDLLPYVDFDVDKCETGRPVGEPAAGILPGVGHHRRRPGPVVCLVEESPDRIMTSSPPSAPQTSGRRHRPGRGLPALRVQPGAGRRPGRIRHQHQ